MTSAVAATATGFQFSTAARTLPPAAVLQWAAATGAGRGLMAGVWCFG